MTNSLDEERGDVATGATGKRKCLEWRLRTLLVASPVSHCIEHAGIDILQQRQRICRRAANEAPRPRSQSVFRVRVFKDNEGAKSGEVVG